MNFIKRYGSRIALVILILGSLFVRLYNLRATQTFLEDEGRDLLIVKRMIDTHKPVLLGPQTSIGSMYLGPFYYYFITPALIASRMDPIGPVILIALTGTLTVWLLFWLTKKWLGEKTAWIVSTFYAFMPLPVSFTRNSWNPNLAPLIALLILYTMDRLRMVKAKNVKWFAVLGLLTGILVQLHYMSLVFVGIYLLFCLIWWFKNKKLLLYGILLGVAGFTLAMLPYLIFELRNNWVNTNAILRFIQAREQPNIRYQLPISLWWKKVITVTTTLFGGLFGPGDYRPFDKWTPAITIVSAIVSFLGIIISPLTKKRKTLLLVSIFGSVAFLGIYQENIHVHYLGFLFVFCYIGFASLAASSNRYLSVLGIALSLVLLGNSLPVTIGNLKSNPNNQIIRAKEVAKYIENRAGGKPYNIASNSKTSTTPYQYFSFLSNNPPSNDWTDHAFLICQDKPCTDQDIHNKQLFITGPAHPSLANYVGHPLANYVMQGIEVVSNDHVSNGVWVAELKLISDNK